MLFLVRSVGYPARCRAHPARLALTSTQIVFSAAKAGMACSASTIDTATIEPENLI
ncbi:hypothetical protein [Novosphingobium sp. JCM 18896]|uniref:hypothetical protein n=1 Tax=Novosphingobium sp. JCM 18896 TaxID=2989731 RepID=UPI0022226588|nr:hypothetical protein [Novosphingobium sp. JCM 18896]MCW1429512.1 hypothetical protein [Novosphingobium sp. JCM 18896]